jgi:GntR family transcriptional regulator
MEPHGSLNQVLHEAGYRIFGERRSVEAVPAPEHVAKLLEVSPGAPVLLVTSISWKKGGQPFDFYNSWVRTDIVKVTVEASAAGK